MKAFLRLENIHKSFVGVHALKGIDFSIQFGNIHCLIGENGSGKSTLIKIISGVLQPDSGRILVDGKDASHGGSAVSISRGIQVIYQDLSLFPNLTAAENIAISELGEQGRTIVRRREVKSIAREAMARIKVDIDPDELVGNLPVGRQQLVAICRALTKEVKLLILDEPTASLPKRDIENLLAVVKDLQQKGISILFVSHKLNEVLEVADQVTVFRDGNNVGTLPRGKLTNEQLVSLMTGRTISETRFKPYKKPVEVLLEVRSLSKRHNFQDVSFKLRAGEIVGVTGLVGSGRTELALALFGISPADSGTILIDGDTVRIRSVQDAVKAGIAYVPENRLSEGLVLRHSTADNTIAAVLRRLSSKFGLINPTERKELAEKWIKNLKIKVSEPSVAVQTLSGGNQQRVVLAKWLASKPRILILDGPTVGIDVMAKSDIHNLIRELAAEGLGVLLISDEVDEVVNNSNRILLMRGGKIRSKMETANTTANEVQRLVETCR